MHYNIENIIMKQLQPSQYIINRDDYKQILGIDSKIIPNIDLVSTNKFIF